MSDGEINVDSIDGEVSTSANIVGELYPKGEKGDKGDKGDTGDTGFSPIIETSKVGKTTTITITDAEGTKTATILDGADGQGSGDMLTSVYDTDHNGIVDNAEKVNNHTVGTDVPANAVFTDTTYTAGTGIDITNGVITNTKTSAVWGNITGTLNDQTDLKNALDSKSNTSYVDGKIGDLSNLTTTATNNVVSAINEVDSHADTNATNIGDLTTLTTTTKSSLVGAVNELDSDKLDSTATATNSTKWNNLVNDKDTENNTDTWIPVLSYGNMQHTTINSIGERTHNYYAQEKPIGQWINGRKLYSQTFGFTNIPKAAETYFYWSNSIYPDNSLSNVHEIVNVKAFFKRSDGTFQPTPNNHSVPADWASGIFDFSETGFRFWVGNLMSSINIEYLIVTIEYTKTTD